MKKATRILGVLTLIFSLLVGLGFSAMEMAEAASDEVTVTLHKKKMTALPEFQQNTGEEMDFFSSYDDMPNVEFTAYDVSTAFYNLRNGGSSVDDAISGVVANPETIGTAVNSPQVTNGDGEATGEATFTLPAKVEYDEKMRDAIYVFVETDAPAGTTQRADNLVLVLPILSANKEVKTHLHLYPKNLVRADNSITIKKVGTALGAALGETLEGAGFKVSREYVINEEPYTEYLGTFNNDTGLWTWVSDIANGHEFVTNADGLVTISNLEDGSYKLHETTAPNNAVIIGDGIKEFEVPKQNGETIEIKNDTIKVDKDVEGERRDYRIGESIPYEITFRIPDSIGEKDNGTYRFDNLIISDIPDTGLQFREIVSVLANDASLASSQYTLSTTFTFGDPVENVTNGFQMTIPAEQLAAHAGKTLTITYHMYLDGSADVDTQYKNMATVNYDRITENDEGPEVKTGGKKFKKVDIDEQTRSALADATFLIRDGESDGALYLHIDNEGLLSWGERSGAEPFTSDEDGLFEVQGLAAGDYWLQEIAAPTGYVLSTEKTKFTVEIGKFETVTLKVVNTREGRLPSTGGSGIVGIVALGAALVATTGGYYIKRKRDE